jgi:hypothetical protein
MLKGNESTFQQQKHDSNKIMKPAEEEWDQSDLWLANYAQNTRQRFLLKRPMDMSGLGTELVWSTVIPFIYVQTEYSSYA